MKKIVIVVWIGSGLGYPSTYDVNDPYTKKYIAEMTPIVMRDAKKLRKDIDNDLVRLAEYSREIKRRAEISDSIRAEQAKKDAVRRAYADSLWNEFRPR